MIVSAFVGLHLRKATGLQGLNLNDTVQGQSWCVSQTFQIGFERMLEILMNLGFF